MKLLLFSDLHCDTKAAERIVERSGDADVIVGAGDFATKRENIAATIEILKQAACPAILVPGNGESAEELIEACADWQQAHVLHGTSATVGGVTFYGIGGGIPTTPFGAWSWDFSEEEAADLLQPMVANSVLVTHSPPWRAVDVDSSGNHRGSQAVRSAIESKPPKLVVCGHIHDSWEQTARIGKTPVINAGPRGVWHELSL